MSYPPFRPSREETGRSSGTRAEVHATTPPRHASARASEERPALRPVDVRDPYAKLEVARTASDEDIRAAYKRLAVRWHPDRPHGDEFKMREVTFSYEVLTDTKRRANFDEFGHASFAPNFDPERARILSIPLRVPTNRIEAVEEFGKAVIRGGEYLKTPEGQKMATRVIKGLGNLQTPEGQARAKGAALQTFATLFGDD